MAGCWASEAKAVEAGWAEAPGGSAAEGSVTAAAAMVAETAAGNGPSVGPSSTLGKAQRGACRQQCREPANNER